MGIAFLYPGQGAQQVGMGLDLHEVFPTARRLFERAEVVTRLPLRKLCFEGPEDQLARTDISQPAIFTVSMALLAVLDDLLGPDKVPQPCCCAGLSLGEYTALAAAGALSFEDALTLVARRGRYMQEAAQATSGGMVSLLGADEAVAEEVCRQAHQGEVLVPANFNAPGQIVLSGTREACRPAMELANACGATGAVALNVAGAFHSPLMQPAAEQLAAALAEARFQAPKVPVIANVTGRPHGGVDDLRRRLVEQLTSPVRWQQSCEYMLAHGGEEFLELGPGRVLTGLMRKIDRRAKCTPLNGRAGLEKYTGVTPQPPV